MAIVFTQNGDGTYDLVEHGRVREYDVERHDLSGALKRARITEGPVYVEDETGYRTRL